MINSLGKVKVVNRAKVEAIIRSNIVVVVAAMAAILTSFMVTPDREYWSYLDFRTLSTLFCMLAIVSALKNIHFFQISATKIVTYFKTTRTSILALVYITFIGSMIIANDMALITFLPLGYYVLNSTNQKKHMAFAFIMQNIAANLGGMLMPFGNPQSLYLYSFFDISSIEFIKIMFLPFIVSIILITTCCLFIKSEKLVISESFDTPLDKKRTILYSTLFLFFLAIIFRYISYIYGLVAITFILLIFDSKALKDIDYPLLLTFTAFFIFAGNVSRIEILSNFFQNIMEKSTLLTGVVACQFISNVPSAILLSRFTENYRELLVAVNIGGTGTLIASLASLITYREYLKHNPNKQLYYLKRFSIYNFGFLTILTVIALIVY